MIFPRTHIKKQQAPKRHRAGKRFAVLAVLVILALAGGRIYLPYWVTDYVNRKISELDGYNGSVKEIDIHLIRGAYQIHKLDIYKTNGGLKTPFVAADTIDLSVEWRALWYGTIVSEIEINGIALTFSKSQNGQGADWTRFIDELTPFEINHLNVNGGKVTYVDPAIKTEASPYIDDIKIEVTNLRNVRKRKDALPSDVYVSGESIGGGALRITGRGNILKQVPDFDLDMKLENASLTALNSYTRDAIGVDFTAGKVGVYSELAAANGHVTGYVKPIITDMQMVDVNEDSNPLHIIWETLVSAFMEIFKNHPQDQFALRIPVDGRIDKPETNMWSGFWSIFRNAFGQAFSRATDGSIDFRKAIEKNRMASE